MKDHTDLLNYIAKKINAKEYLEIGVFNLDHNFNKIEVENKIGVGPDPKAKATVEMASDDFFSELGRISGINPIVKRLGLVSFDLIFVDGLHHAEQVAKDLKNAWRCLRAGGVIVMHDCNPPTEITTCIPRGSQREWCGDVYKVALATMGGDKFTVDFDYGCMVLRKKTSQSKLSVFDSWQHLLWEDFEEFGKRGLQLKSVEESLKIIDAWT